MLLVNPGTSIATPQIFKSLPNRTNSRLPKFAPDSGWGQGDLLTFLQLTRNDLEPPALEICPAIGDVIKLLIESGALLARMSGSGATCFGIFEDDLTAKAAGQLIARAKPNWWVA